MPFSSKTLLNSSSNRSTDMAEKVSFNTKPELHDLQRINDMFNMFVGTSATRLSDLLVFGQLFKAFGNN